MPNTITVVTRQHIADEMQVSSIWYHGRQTEPDFLARIFDLRSLKSRDPRYNNAYDDIYQHMVNNTDWDTDWVYTDPRINLLHCDDETYKKFIAQSLHPLVRTDSDELQKLLHIYNKYLVADGYEATQNGDISGKPTYAIVLRGTAINSLGLKKADIKKYLNTTYVNSKITLMHDSITKDTALAIGTAKELLETVCKSILKQKGKLISNEWTLSQLLNNTTLILDFKSKDADDPEKAEKGIKQILGGISTIVHGVTELRNGYGSGHGKDANFKGLDIKYARLFVGVVSEIAIILLAVHGESAELVEAPSTNDLPF